MSDGPAHEPCSLMLRGGIVMPTLHDSESIVEQGAVCVRGDRIVAVGPYEQLSRDYVARSIRGTDRHLVIPGLINAHDHVRAPSTRQLGVPDDILEARIVDLLRLPQVDPRLACTLACCQMLQSGVTTVVSSFYEASAERYERVLPASVAGCERSGIRTVFALSILDRSIVAELLSGVRPHLPSPMRARVSEFLDSRDPMEASRYFDLVRAWHDRTLSGRVGLMMGPVSVHWCSDELLQAIWEQARELKLPLQSHLLESRYQRDRAAARYGQSAVHTMSDAGLLTPMLSCAHCVHVSDADLELLAESGTSVIHCAGSNQRTRSGTAPVARMLERGVNVGLGLDSLAMSDDGDMLREMRLVARGSDEGECRNPVPDASVLRMAAANGASALGMLDDIGTLAPGKKADIVALKMSDRLCGDAQAGKSVLGKLQHGLVNAAERSDIDMVVVDGEIVMEDGRHRYVDPRALLEEIHASLDAGSHRRPEHDSMIAALKPYVHGLLDRSLRTPPDA